MLDRFLLAWLIGLSGLAYYWPHFAPEATDPFPWISSQIHLLIMVAMFSIGLMLPHNEVTEVFQRWKSVIGGTLAQYTAMPLLALTFGRLLVQDESQFIGVVLVGCVPGAMASNVLTLKAQGNASYSVSLTTLATLVSPAAVPIAIFLTLKTWAGEQALTLLNSSLYMTAVVVLPVIVGFLLHRTLRSRSVLMTRLPRMVANLAILVIIATVVAQNRQHFTQPALPMLAALLLINLGGYGAGQLAARSMRLDARKRRALTLEVGMQNAGVGVGLANYLFPDTPSIAVAPAIYTFGCMVTGSCLAHIWSSYFPLQDGFCSPNAQARDGSCSPNAQARDGSCSPNAQARDAPGTNFPSESHDSPEKAQGMEAQKDPSVPRDPLNED